MPDDLSVLILRELDALQREVELYPDEAALWRAIPGVPNAGGTLVLHLVGNLRYFIGGILGQTGYVRDRESEFSQRGVPRTELLGLIAKTRTEVDETLRHLPQSTHATQFPVAVGGVSLSTGLFLHHLLSHLAYHLGQLDYHRRTSTGNPVSANALPLAALKAGRTLDAGRTL